MTMDSAGQSTTAPKRPRWLYGALVASLALNLAMLGGAAGAFWHHRHEHRGDGLTGFVRQLPADRQGPLRDFLKGEREKLKPVREEIRAGWRETNTLLGQEPFDKDKLKAAMGRMNDAEGRMRAAIADALVETAGKMTPEERQSMKAWRERQIERGMRKWRRHWGDEDRGEPPPPPGPPPN